MLLHNSKRAILTVVLTLGVMACEPAGTLSGSSGRSNDYLVARQALETGNYTLAARRYERLLTVTGDAAGRIQLEYAHSLLRGGRLADAITVSDKVIASNTGSLKANALAVRGTARHQQAREMIGQRQSGPELRSLLTRARADLDLFVTSYPKLDAAGAMAARVQMIEVDLREIG